jgi:hypothetical protein
MAVVYGPVLEKTLVTRISLFPWAKITFTIQTGNFGHED